ncbi:MAG: M15 family metallopeptidase [Defluviitaleaceae bacterium]|nr:M15 family metallopeptidase [Defluviitaleaceae bacterium]
MRKRYREPVFSGGFTALLLVIILVGCGVIFFVLMGDGFRDGIASLRAPYNYGSETGSNEDYVPNQDTFEGNASIDENQEQDNNMGDTYISNDTTVDDDIYDNEIAYNDYDSADTTPGTGLATNNTGDIVLLTEVENTLLPWYLKLVNRYNSLDYYFYPQLAYLGVGGGHRFDARAYRALLNMLESAREYGLNPVVVSSFRSVSRQTYLFNRQVQRHIDAGYSADDAFEAARRVVAYPGTSEHNLGLAVDIVSSSYTSLTAYQAYTPEGIWLAANSYRYGFVLRYPYYQQHITNIIFEPWHFRYVGVAAATEMFERGLVLEEYVSERLAQSQ